MEHLQAIFKFSLCDRKQIRRRGQSKQLNWSLDGEENFEILEQREATKQLLIVQLFIDSGSLFVVLPFDGNGTRKPTRCRGYVRSLNGGEQSEKNDACDTS